MKNEGSSATFVAASFFRIYDNYAQSMQI